jgi:hypothetical protein
LLVDSSSATNVASHVDGNGSSAPPATGRHIWYQEPIRFTVRGLLLHWFRRF